MAARIFGQNAEAGQRAHQAVERRSMCVDLPRKLYGALRPFREVIGQAELCCRIENPRDPETHPQLNQLRVERGRSRGGLTLRCHNDAPSGVLPVVEFSYGVNKYLENRDVNGDLRFEVCVPSVCDSRFSLRFNSFCAIVKCVSCTSRKTLSTTTAMPRN